MSGNWNGLELGRKLRSPRAARKDAERSARIDAWAARHWVLTMLGVAALCALAAWWLAVKRDGATTGELVFWVLVLVPAGLVSTWIALARIRRRTSA